MSENQVSPFTKPFEEIEKALISKGVSISNPGFYNDLRFIEVERKDPNFLNYYAAFVASRSYGDEYQAFAKAKTEKAAELLYDALVENGRLGACIDMSGILGKILEEEGVWNCVIRGSLTLTFPDDSGIEPRHYWSVNEREFYAGHAWVYAPPFTVVDLTIGQQVHAAEAKQYIPNMVLSENTEPVDVDFIDYMSNEIRNHLGGAKQQLRSLLPNVPEIFKLFPPTCVDTGQMTLKYAPAAPGAMEETFEENASMHFRGHSPYEFYMLELKETLRDVL